MNWIAELQGAPENDNGIPYRPEPAATPAPAKVLEVAPHNDGEARAVESLVLFLQPEQPAEASRGAVEDVDGDLVVLPILRPAIDDEESVDVEKILNSDPTFAQILDDARERWPEWMEYAARHQPGEVDADDAEPKPEGDDDHECA